MRAGTINSSTLFPLALYYIIRLISWMYHQLEIKHYGRDTFLAPSGKRNYVGTIIEKKTDLRGIKQNFSRKNRPF